MDLVYLVRNGDKNEDLRVSLRSIAKYKPDFDNIWIVGYKPSWVNDNVGYVETGNPNRLAWKNARDNLVIACQTDEISEDFILMNDDFVLTKPIKSWTKSINKVMNTFEDQIKYYNDIKLTSNYTKAFSNCVDLIKKLSGKRKIYNYERHAPMIINKKKFLDLYNNKLVQEYINNSIVWLYRSFYGNIYDIKFETIADDVKLDNKDYQETNDEWLSFFDNYVGNVKYPRLNKYLSSNFSNRCIYEKQVIKVYDHLNHPLWCPLYKQRHLSRGRTNGGYTYSQDIVKFQIPLIIDILKKQDKYQNIVISTVTMIDPCILTKTTDLVICYLHESIERELSGCLKIRKFYDKKIIFICSRKDVYNKLRAVGFKCIFIPMSIDTKQLKDYVIPKNEKYQDKRVIYFGNKYLGKDTLFAETKAAFIRNGWTFDEISSNIFNNNGVKLSRDEIFNILTKYKYGIAGGRCALEMNYLGIKTLISMETNQGIWTTDEEFKKHIDDNFAGNNLCTYSKDLDECINNFDKAICKTIDSKEVLPELEKQLKEIIK